MASPPDAFAPFEALWPFDAIDLVAPAKRVFLRLDETQRALALRWAPDYLAECKARGVKRMAAANWLRAKGWEAFKAKGEAAARPSVFVKEGSPQWFAWLEYHKAARDVPMHGGRLMAFDLKERGRGRMERSEWPPKIERAAS